MLNETTFKNNIVTWFEKNQREMPWRETTNPYYIWLSEVMLQQTQVKTVIDYYNKFIHRFPTIEALSCLLYTSPSPRDKRQSRMPSSA